MSKYDGVLEMGLEFAPEDMPSEVLPPVVVNIQKDSKFTDSVSADAIRSYLSSIKPPDMEERAFYDPGKIGGILNRPKLSEVSESIFVSTVKGLGSEPPFASGGLFINDKMISSAMLKEPKMMVMPKAPHIPVEEGLVNLIWAEMERFGKDTDEEVNIREVFGRVLKEMSSIAGLHGTTLNEILENTEMAEEEKSPSQLALEALATKMTGNWKADEFTLEPETFTVNSSLSLTVWREDKGGYRKHPHIGGEDFTPTKAHVGAKGHLIVSFKPNQPEPYNWMEMPLTDCLVHLTGFQNHFVREFGADWATINNAKAEAKQAADIAKFGASYTDFGSY